MKLTTLRPLAVISHYILEVLKYFDREGNNQQELTSRQNMQRNRRSLGGKMFRLKHNKSHSNTIKNNYKKKGKNKKLKTLKI